MSSAPHTGHAMRSVDEVRLRRGVVRVGEGATANVV